MWLSCAGPLAQPMRYVVVVNASSDDPEIVGPFDPDAANGFVDKLGDTAHIAPLRRPAISEAAWFVEGIQVRTWGYPRPTDDG
jgi:hypothetical protein